MRFGRESLLPLVPQPPDCKRMPGRPPKRARRARRGVYTLNRGGSLFFCGCFICALALLIVASVTAPAPRALPRAPAELPVATIELLPDRNGLCRHLRFHNDSGRFEEGGSGRCGGPAPDDKLLVIRGKRDAAIAQAFKFR
jgi:hypothetical protein